MTGTPSFYTSPQWAAVQELHVEKISERMVQHANFLGYDIGNEMDNDDALMLYFSDRARAEVRLRLHELKRGESSAP